LAVLNKKSYGQASSSNSNARTSQSPERWLPFKNSNFQKMKQRTLLTTIICLITFISFGQIDPNNVPKPPTEKLKIF